MMPRRALHLRWNYVLDHLVLFGALLIVLLAAMVATLAFLEDPARGLLVGALPVLFLGFAWALTNAASYRHRHPDALPPERTESPEPDRPTHEGDPFAQPPEPLSPAELALKTAGGKKKAARSRKKKSDAA